VLTTTAIVLGVEGIGPADPVAGVPVVLRALLTLQKEGVTRAFVVADEGDASAIDALLRDPRLRIETVRVPSLAVARERADSSVLIVRPEIVVDPAMLRALLSRPTPNVAATKKGVRIGPVLIAKDADVDSRLQELEVEHWSADVRTPQGRHEATRMLFEACRKPVDGLVSRNLNRHVSIFVSKRIVDLAITPNQVSAITFVIGAIGAACASRGTYSLMLLGAVLFQLNSILDGVDGELARVRFQGTKLGEWIDTVADDTSNVLFYAAVGWGAHKLAVPAWLPWLGVVAVAGGVLTSTMYYAELIRLGRGDFYALEWSAPDETLVGRIYGVLKLLLKKDFFIFLFVIFAAFGALPWALPLMAAGTVVTTFAATGRTLRWAFSRSKSR